jgi:hypothetical protein
VEVRGLVFGEFSCLFHCQIEWILTGEGEPLRPIGQASQVHSLSERVKTAAPSLQKQIESFLDFHRVHSSLSDAGVPKPP